MKCSKNSVVLCQRCKLYNGLENWKYVKCFNRNCIFASSDNLSFSFFCVCTLINCTLGVHGQSALLACKKIRTQMKPVTGNKRCYHGILDQS